MDENSRKKSENSKDSSLFLMVIFGLFVPLYEIVTLLSVVATTVDPLFPNLNTILSLMAPALIAALFAFMMYIDLSDRPVAFYIFIALIIGVGGIVPMFFMYPIFGYIDDTNLWGLVNVNIVIYIGSVILVIYKLYKNTIFDDN